MLTLLWLLQRRPGQVTLLHVKEAGGGQTTCQANEIFIHINVHEITIKSDFFSIIYAKAEYGRFWQRTLDLKTKEHVLPVR